MRTALLILIITAASSEAAPVPTWLFPRDDTPVSEGMRFLGERGYLYQVGSRSRDGRWVMWGCDAVGEARIWVGLWDTEEVRRTIRRYPQPTR